VLVDSLPVTETDVQKLLTTLESRENGAQRQHNAVMHPRKLTPSTECVEVTVKLHRRRCVGCVHTTCDKFNNRLYNLKTDYQLETGLLAGS